MVIFDLKNIYHLQSSSKFILRFLTIGGRDGLWWPALSRHLFSCTGCLYLLCTWYDQCLGYCFYIYAPPLDVYAHGHSFLNNGFDNTEWASFISDLHVKLRIISRGVPGFATASPCGVWGHGWTTCLLFDGPLSGLCFSKITVGM